MKTRGLYTAHKLQPPSALDELVETVMAKVRAEIGTVGLAYLKYLKQLPDGRQEERVVEVDGEAETALDALLAGQGGKTRTIPKVDVRGQLEPYLNEGDTRTEATKVETRRSLVMYLDLCEKEALPYDAISSVARFKAFLGTRIANGKTLTVKTINFHVGRVTQLLTWLGNNGVIPKQTYQDIKIKTKKTHTDDEEREAMPAAEVKRLLSIMDVRLDHKAFLPHMLAYTAARLNEICQLWLDDFVVKDGVHCIRIDTKHEYQQIKNPQSRRHIPIHPYLVELGLLEAVEEMRSRGEKRFFPSWRETRPGLSGSPWLLSYITKPYTIHGIRHACATQLAYERGVPEPVVNRIMGHSAFKTIAQAVRQVARGRGAQGRNRNLELALGHPTECNEREALLCL